MSVIKEKKLFVVLIDGPMGSGKTTASKLLNDKIQGSVRIALADVKRFISGWEENENVARVSKQVMKGMVREYLREGVPVIVETIAKTNDVEVYAGIAEEVGAQFLAYRLTAPREILVERIEERTRQMMNVSILPSEKVAELGQLFQRNYQFYLDQENSFSESVDTSKLTPGELVNLIERSIISSEVV